MFALVNAMALAVRQPVQYGMEQPLLKSPAQLLVIKPFIIYRCVIYLV